MAREYPYRATVDLDTAASAAMVDYLKDIEFQIEHATSAADPNPPARTFKFAQWFYDWPEAEKDLKFPALSITNARPVIETGMAPIEVLGSRFPEEGDGHYLIQNGEAVIPMQIDVWTSRPSEQRAIVRKLQDVLGGNDGSGGIALALGDYYYNVQAGYALKSWEKMNNAEDAQRGVRRVTFFVDAQVPVVALRECHDLRIEIRDEIGPDVVVSPTT